MWLRITVTAVEIELAQHLIELGDGRAPPVGLHDRPHEPLRAKLLSLGDQRVELGSRQLAPAQVQGGHTFTHISSGGAHTCGLTDDGDVFCWGLGENGRLGTGNPLPRLTPALVDAGFADLGLARISSTVDVRNVASIRVLEKTGLRWEATLRRLRKVRGEWRDCHLYAIARTEWEAARAG